MSVTCVVFPRKDLSTDECKELGKGIYEWLYADPGNRYVLPPGMEDLRSGELPQQYYMQRLVGVEGRGLTDEERAALGEGRVKDLPREERERLREKWGRSRLVELTVYGREGDRNEVVASLEQHVPADLVEDILVDGDSWK